MESGSAKAAHKVPPPPPPPKSKGQVPDKGGGARLPSCGFAVQGGKNGSTPIKVEKRPKGKKVTIISNVSGSAKSLLSALGTLLGCGGTCRQVASGLHWTVEIQGDQIERVNSALVQLGCLRGVKKETSESKKKQPAETVNRNCGYDKFLRRGEPTKAEATSSSSLTFELCEPCSVPLHGAECSLWHGPWVYCRGRCEQHDFSDVWHDALDGGHMEEVKCGTAGSSAMRASLGIEDLNARLRSLGMLAERGSALPPVSSRKKKGNFVAAIETGDSGTRPQTFNPAAAGVTLSDYRKAAIGPGARLIDDEPPVQKKGKTDKSKSQLPKRRAPPALTGGKPLPKPPKIGHFSCALCGCAFGLQRTLRTHIKAVHPNWKMLNVNNGIGRPPGGPNVAAPLEQSGHWLSRGTESLARAWMPPTKPPACPQVHDAVHQSPAAAALPTPKFEHPTPQQALAEQRAEAAAKEWHRQQCRIAAGDMQTCPLCSRRFPESVIESHVDACLVQFVKAETAKAGAERQQLQKHKKQQQKQPQVTNMQPERQELMSPAKQMHVRQEVPQSAKIPETSSDDETKQVRLFLARSNFQPSGEGSDTQMALKKGDEVGQIWRQPETEGGYWMWVFQVKDHSIRGYVPAQCLEFQFEVIFPKSILPAQEGDFTEHKQSRESAPAAAVPGTEFSDCSIPEEWLESFLLLDLTEDLAAKFWDHFESLRVDMPLEGAWLAAIQRTTGGPEAPGLLVGETATGSIASVWQNGDEVFAEEQEEDEEDHVRDISDNSTEQGELGFHTVVKPWLPNSRDETQLWAPEGSLVRVDWRQPQEEGGYWAYCHREDNGEDRVGYIPLMCLGSSCEEDADVEEEFAEDDGTDARFSCQQWVDARKESQAQTSRASAPAASFTGDLYMIREAWEPRDDTQLRVALGSCVRVLWWQPEEEGGYWVYCNLTHSADKTADEMPLPRGYLPRNCLGSRKEGEVGSSGSTFPSNGAADVKVTRQPANAKVSQEGCQNERSVGLEVDSSDLKNNKDGQAGSGCVPQPVGASRWRRRYASQNRSDAG